MAILLPIILVKLLVKLKNRKLFGFPNVLIEPSINYARLIANDFRALLTWEKGIKIIWQDWNLGLGKINKRVQKGDILLMRGKNYNIYILVVYDVISPEVNINTGQLQSQWYEFQTIFTGVIWNKQTYRGYRT